MSGCTKANQTKLWVFTRKRIKSAEFVYTAVIMPKKGKKNQAEQQEEDRVRRLRSKGANKAPRR